jgi:hypothetical protein
MNIYGISKGGLHHAQKQILTTILNCGALDISLPTEASEWEKVKNGFASKRLNQVLTGCCSALDGFFQPTKCLVVKESDGFPRAYFLSGH